MDSIPYPNKGLMCQNHYVTSKIFRGKAPNPYTKFQLLYNGRCVHNAILKNTRFKVLAESSPFSV